MKYHRTLNERKMVVFVVQTSRYFGPCRILPYPAVSCRILPYLPYPAVSCRILPYPAYPAVSCRILPYPAVSCRILPYPAVSPRIMPYRIRVTGKPHCTELWKSRTEGKNPCFQTLLGPHCLLLISICFPHPVLLISKMRRDGQHSPKQNSLVKISRSQRADCPNKCIIINQTQAQGTAFLADSECKYMQSTRRAPACMRACSTVTAEASGCPEGCLGPHGGHSQFPGCNFRRSSVSPLPLPSASTKQIKGSVGMTVHRLHLHKHI